MDNLDRRKFIRAGLGASCLSLLAACAPMGFDFGPLANNGKGQTPPGTLPPGTIADGTMVGTDGTNLPPATGKTLGTGPVRVAMLLPLSGAQPLAGIATSMANGAALAMDYIAQSANIKDNITLVIKDTGPNPSGAAERASEALSEGASLILGPLSASQVSAAAGVARPAGIPVIGFSNNPAVAAPGVYLLSVLPEVEVGRSLGYAKAHGKTKIAAIFPTTPYGQAQKAAFEKITAQLGIRPLAVYDFGNDGEARQAITLLAPHLRSGKIDTLFMPDLASAPSIAALLTKASVRPEPLTIIGSADWDNGPGLDRIAFFNGAIFPGVDSAGYRIIAPQYQAKFGTTPSPLVTIAYTAAILANASTLSLGTPRYDPALLTLPGGFNGRDGVFKFFANGTCDYALAMKKITPNGVQQIEAAKL